MRIKILTLLTGLFLFSNLTFAQSVGEYRVRKTETVTRKIEKPKKPKVVRENNLQGEGFFVVPEVGIFGVDFQLGAYYLNFQGTFGYEFNNHLALGVGLGYYFSTISHYYTYVPLYINLYGDITKKPIAKNITPYYSLDFGYNLCVRSYERYSRTKYNDGLLFTPELGIRINNFHIGTAFMITKYHSSIYNYYYGYYYEHDNVNLVLSLKLGYKIPLRFW